MHFYLVNRDGGCNTELRNNTREVIYEAILNIKHWTHAASTREVQSSGHVMSCSRTNNTNKNYTGEGAAPMLVCLVTNLHTEITQCCLNMAHWSSPSDYFYIDHIHTQYTSHLHYSHLLESFKSEFYWKQMLWTSKNGPLTLEMRLNCLNL